MFYKKNPSAYTRCEKCRHIDRDKEECKVTNDKWLVCDDAGECRQFSQEGVNMKVRCDDNNFIEELLEEGVEYEAFEEGHFYCINLGGKNWQFSKERFVIVNDDKLQDELSAKYHIPTYDKETYIGVESNDSGNNNPIKPNHYNSGKFDVIDFCFRHNLDFASGNVVKYIVRAGKKDKNKELEDLLKAKEYLNRKIERVKAND